MHEHRTWFPFILIGLTLSFVILLAVVWRPGTVVPISVQPDVTYAAPVPVDANAYKEQARTALTRYQESGDAANAYKHLLDLRVPAELKDTHLELVVALSLIDGGNEQEGEDRLHALLLKEAWLN